MERDTIFAQATPPGRAGIAVVRVSGPRAVAALEQLTGRPAPERPALRRIFDADGVEIDRALVLVFPDGHSFTGELTVEIQGHGGFSAPAGILASLGRLAGLRLAEPGEFTRRALENGRIDLVQVEGLADLIEAETAAQRDMAMRSMGGAFSRQAEAWRSDLLRARALVEATIDFADEEDAPTDVSDEVLVLVRAVQDGLHKEIRGAAAARRIREGFEVALVGAPNAGKSTLLNALAGRDVAITSEIAGTTRDVIEVRLDLGGLAVTVLDMAGLRETEDRIERLGVSRAAERAEAADLRVFLTAPDAPASGIVARKPGDVEVAGKADLGQVGAGLPVSGLTGKGVGRLLVAIGAELSSRVAGAGAAAHERQVAALIAASSHLDAALAVISENGASELVAEELRRGLDALGRLVGQVDVEQVLDEIFSRFCLGK